ncbi:MAG: polysaccharide pyruvyl transferase CsaB [Candidatus Gastranaerophilales bacterium]|nr:polysaccharide pyruvyl transferase CsaB [Candidatus Gastranaerophilales bacterium]
MSVNVLISGYIGFSNFGDDAMLSILVEHLKEKKCNITALSSNIEQTKKKYGVNAFYYKNFKEILSAIKNTDILIQGGGTLLQNETSNANLFYYLSLIFLAKIFSKKVIIFSQGIGPINGAFSNFLTKIALKLADVITVRDSASIKILSRWHMSSHLVNDIVWDAKILPYAPENAIGVQIRACKNMDKNFLTLLAKYVDMHFSEFEIRIFSFQNAQDTAACYNFERALKARNHLVKTKVFLYEDTKKMIEEFSKLKYLIAMRLHANILGLKYGVKVLPVAYSDKVRNFAREFGLEYMELALDAPVSLLFNTLTVSEQKNGQILNARKSKFEWNYIDSVIAKQREKK